MRRHPSDNDEMTKNPSLRSKMHIFITQCVPVDEIDGPKMLNSHLNLPKSKQRASGIGGLHAERAFDYFLGQNEHDKFVCSRMPNYQPNFVGIFSSDAISA